MCILFLFVCHCLDLFFFFLCHAIRYDISLSYEKQMTLECCYRYSSVFLFSVSFVSSARTSEGQQCLILFWKWKFGD